MLVILALERLSQRIQSLRLANAKKRKEGNSNLEVTVAEQKRGVADMKRKVTNPSFNCIDAVLG